MIDYISKSKLISKVLLMKISFDLPEEKRACDSIIREIEKSPIEDAEKVIRCKDCFYCDDLGMAGLYCCHPDGRNTIHCRPDDYCNDGVMRSKEVKTNEIQKD